jgi:hypothetical protein
MRLFSIIGLLAQLLGAWFLCRIFYKLHSTKFGARAEPWDNAPRNLKLGGPWSRIGNLIFLARGLPGEERREDIPLIADPNATRAFIFLALGTIFQILGLFGS